MVDGYVGDGTATPELSGLSIHSIICNDAIKADIVGTGGSSGSAIIDSIDSTVIGIAQNVFTVGVAGYTEPLYSGDAEGPKEVPIVAQANMGLVYGISFYQFHNILVRIQKEVV
jgi:hypothetical protein